MPLPTLPTLTVSSQTLHKATVYLAGQFIQILDPSAVGFQQLQLWDSNGTPAGGEWLLFAQPQSGGHEIDVPFASLPNLGYVTGSVAGSDTMWARLKQNDGSLTDWQQFTVTVAEPTISVHNLTAVASSTTALFSLVGVTDPSVVGYQKLELWDSNGTAAGGQFFIAAAAQTGGHEIDLTSTQVNAAIVSFRAGTAAGTDRLYARLLQADNSLTDWQPFTVTLAEPTLSASSVTTTVPTQIFSLSSLVAITDPSHLGYQKLELWDSNGTAAGGQFIVGATPQTGGHEIDLTFAQVITTAFRAGTAEGTDKLWARLLQADGSLTDWQPFTVTVPQPTLTVHNLANQPGSAPLSQLVTISDPANVGYQKLELWDTNGTQFGGQLVVNGLLQTGGHEIDIAPGQVPGASFFPPRGGTDTLYARLLQNDNSLTPWQAFTVTMPYPTMIVQDLSNAGSFTIGLNTLVHINDPALVGYQQLQLYDTNGATLRGQLIVNGILQTGGHEIDVPATNVNSIGYTPPLGGSDTLYARLLQNDGSLSAWQQFTVTNPLPTMSVSSMSLSSKNVFGLINLTIHINDPVNVGYQQLQLWDTNGTALGGQLIVNNQLQTGGHEIDVPFASVNSAAYAPPLGGTDTLYARLLQNDGSLTAWQQFTVTVLPQPTFSVSSLTNLGTTTIQLLSAAVHINDPVSVGFQQLQLYDTNGTALGGHLSINGVTQTGGHEIDVPFAIASSVLYTSPFGGTDTVYARLLQNDGSLTAWQQFTATNLQPTLGVSNLINQGTTPVTLLSATVHIVDPFSVGFQQLQLYDTNGTALGGHLSINGVTQTGGHEIDVPFASVSSISYTPPFGGTDTVSARLLQNDGSLTAWQTFTATNPQPTLAVSNLTNLGTSTIQLLNAAVHIVDPVGVGFQQLQLWDTNGTALGGHLSANGATQTGGHEIDVPFASVSSVTYTPPFGGTDTVSARLLQNDGTLTPWQNFTATNPQPTLTVHNVTTATPGQVISLSGWATIVDPFNVGYQQLQLWDSNGTAATGQFKISGVAQTGGHEIDVSRAVVNTGGAVVFDEGTIGNTDTLFARLLQNDGTLTPWQSFTVVDPLDVAPGATLELTSAYAGTVYFTGATGTLQLDDSPSFSGTVAGMVAQDTLDLRDINFVDALLPTFSGTSSGGTLAVSDGVHSASIALLGNYLASSFVASSDGHGGTSIVSAAATAPSDPLAPLHQA